jgi:hypothetical protein
MATSLGSQISEVAALTEQTDVNHLLGRQGGYTSAAILNDADVDDPAEPLGVSYGAVVEVFGSDEEAGQRADYVGSIVSAAPELAQQQVWRDGNAVLRVTSEVPPSVAEQYRSAFEKAVG